ncbi:unnamed protein product [Alopecurus aequalis]
MESLPRTPGASFAPQDADLLTLYLGPKIAGEPLPSTTAPYIHDLDVYAAEPATLVSGLLHASEAKNGGKEWYFYTTVQAKSNRDSRRCRTVAGGAGTWHSEKARQEIVDQEEHGVIGYRHSFTYEPKNGWLMTEYSLVGQEGGRGQAMPVLCKIYRSPKSISASSMSGSKKRKAAESAGSSGRVRRRLQFAIPPLAANPCIEARAEQTSEELQGAFLVPIQPQTTEQEQGAFLVPTESETDQESAGLQRGAESQQEPLAPMASSGTSLIARLPLDPIEARADKIPEESQGQGAFLVPIEPQTEKPEGLQRGGMESQQEPLRSMAQSRTSAIARMPMDIRRALACTLSSMGLPFEDFATADEINAHYGSIFLYELNSSNAMILPSNSAGVWASRLPPRPPTAPCSCALPNTGTRQIIHMKWTHRCCLGMAISSQSIKPLLG